MGNPLPVNLSAECRKADKIIKDFVDPVNGLDRVIPLTVLRRAKGFAIFSIFRVGFVLTARAGSGVVIAKLPDGSWSAPSALGIGGIGGGFSAGAEVTDFIVVLNSRSAVKSFMATGSLQLGGNLSLAVGPLGRSAEASGALNSSGEVAAMFSYSKSQGLFGGVSLEGTALVDRSDANSKAYNRSITAKKILSGAVDVPAFAQGLIGTIERLSLTGRMSEAARADELEPGAGRDSWSMDDDRDPQDDDDDDLYARPRRAGRNSNNTSKQNDGLESYFSQAELDSRQRRYEREQLTGAAYNRAPPAIPSTSVIPRHSPSPPPASSSSQTTRDPFATSDDEQDPYSLDRDNATRNAGAYTFSSQSGGSLTNSPSATRGDGGGTPGGGRKRSDSRASFKGAAAGYFDEYLNKDKRSYSPIDGKRPSVGHRKASSSFSIPKFGRKTPPAFGSAARPTDNLISADPTDSFNERFRSDEDSADVNAATHNWNRDASPGPASPADTPAFGAPDYDERLSSRHRPPSSRKGSSSLFSFGGNNNNSSASASSAYGANGGLKKKTAADAIRAAAAGGGGVGGLGRGKASNSTSNDAFSDIWDAERARASTQGSSSSYNNGLDSLDEELQRGGSLRRPAGGGGGGGAGYPNSTSFSDDVNGATPPTTTSRFSPVNFFRTNSGGVKSAGSNATATGGGGRSGSGAGFRTNSGGGFRSGSGGGFRTSSRNSNSNNGGGSGGGGGGLSNFVGVGMARVGSNSGRNGGDRGKNGNGTGNSHLLGSSSEGEDDDRDGADAYHARRRNLLHTHVQESSSGANSYDDGAQVSLSTNHDHIPPSTSSHSQSQGGAAGGVADDWGLSHLSMNNSTSNPTTTSTTQRVVASFDFAGQEADDLRFNRGDVIVVLKKTASTNDWWLGRTADGRVGNFPANFVEGV